MKISEPLASNTSDLLYEDDSRLHYFDPPDTVDWRQKGAVTPVQNQVSQWLCSIAQLYMGLSEANERSSCVPPKRVENPTAMCYRLSMTELVIELLCSPILAPKIDKIYCSLKFTKAVNKQEVHVREATILDFRLPVTPEIICFTITKLLDFEMRMIIETFVGEI